MAHPYYHSVSSVEQWGGVWQDYIDIHCWLDHSKRYLADFRHRALRHHREGVKLLCRIVGEEITNSDGRKVAVFEIGKKHILEDLGTLPSIDDWFFNVDSKMMLPRTPLNSKQQTAASVEKWGGDVTDFLKIHQFLDQPHIAGKARPVFHNAAGVFQLEEVFGLMLSLANGKKIPVRVVAEKHIQFEYGYIPVLSDWLLAIPSESWMMRVAKPSKQIMGEVAVTEQAHLPREFRRV